ncbi:Ig-like domain-containing protein [candidate division TA06 bacterium]|nr:Ig-like domain-containing protein [candidate division TA06 bacterium]
MKKVWLLMLPLLMSFSIGFGATYYWTGSTDTQFSTSTNWSPVRSVGLTTDTLVFQADSTVNDTVTLIPTQTVSFFKITTSTNIIVQTGSGKQTLSIGDSLIIDSGASLTVNSPVSAADTLVIYLNTNARGAIGGSVTFNYFGTTTGPRHRLSAADSLAIQFTSGSALVQNTIGNIFGTNAGNNRVVFGPGSQFIQYLGSNPFGVSAPGSKVLFQPGSWFRLRMNSSPSFSGRSYANFELDFPAFSQTATGGNPVSIDTLQITDGRLTLGLQRINIKGDIMIAAAETLLFRQAGTGGVACSLKFYGTAPQTIDSSGQLLFLNDSTSVYVDNASGLTINRVFPVGYNLSLINGVVTANDTLKMRSDQMIQRTNGYVVGNLTLHVATTGSMNRTFPLGTANGYSPAVVVFSTVTAPGYLTCRATQTTHPDAAIPANSLQRYWSFANEGVSFDSYQLNMSYRSGDFNSGFTESADENSMLVGRNDSGTWTFPSILSRDTALNYIEVFGNTFSDFTLAKNQNALIPDTVSPAITGTSPADGATEVALDAGIFIAFSEPMDTLSLAGSMTPSPNEQPAWSGTMDTLFLPHDPMAVNTAYTVRLTALNDLAGNPLTVLPDSFSFTTTVGDTVKPYIISTYPADGAIDVARDVTIYLAFSEPVNPSSFEGYSTPELSATMSWSAGFDTLWMDPDTLMAYNTKFTLVCTTAADLAGNPLAVLPDSFSFTTTVGDTVKPYIVSTSPADGDSNVPRNQPVMLSFSEPIDPASFNGYSVPDCNFNPSWNATFDTLTLSPDTLYSYSTTITMSCTTGTDTSGNRIAGLPVTFSFTTIANQGPAITLVEQPQDSYDGAGPFLVRAVITDPAKAGIAADTLWYSDSRANWWAVTHSTIDGDTFNFSIPGPFASGTIIEYFFGAWDDGGEVQYDPGMYRGYQFRILDPLPPDSLTAVAGDQQVQLEWAPPAEVLEYDDAPNYFWNWSAGNIFSTRFTPQHYPCKIEQAVSMWYNSGAGVDSIEVHIWPDDGTGIPDTMVELTMPFKVLPDTYPNWTVIDISASNIVLSTGDFHIGYVCQTADQPTPLSDGSGPGLHTMVYDGSNWGNLIAMTTNYYDFNNKASVSYSNYSKGLALKSYTLQPGAKILPVISGLKPKAIPNKKAPAYPNLAGALFIAKNISGYSIFRGNVSGGPYTLVGTTGLLNHIDYSVINYNTYYYVVRAEYSTPDTFSAWSNEVSASPTGVEGQPGTQNYSFFLSPANPNPVKGNAEFRFGLPRDGKTSLEIYNVLGQRVKTLVNGNLPAGSHTVKWNGCDEDGRKVSSGVYVYRLITGDNTSTRRLTVIR